MKKCLIKEITLEELCKKARMESGEEYYPTYTYEYYTKNGKIYEKITDFDDFDELDDEELEGYSKVIEEEN